MPGHTARSSSGGTTRNHHHSGIALLTPAQVPEAKATTVIERRKNVLQAAYLPDPERFRNKAPPAASTT
ncbi:MAG: hypothetical protein D6698_10280 [Gammaproteobacteria bacterium]|nr:MAG: hypothetical protein D6698_10280 [Gammaproteobacteria bacterium]